MRLKKIMYFWIFRGGLGEARLSQTSSKGNKVLTSCQKMGSTIMKRKLAKNEQPTYWIFQEENMHLIQRRFLCVLPHLNRSTYEILQILSISLTDKTHLRVLFDKTNFNDVKDQFSQIIPGLFD